MNTYMNLILEQRFFRLLSEYSQRKVSASEFTEAIEELATHVADFGINEQDYSILLRYFPLVYTVLNRIVYGLSKKKMPYLHLIDEAIGLLNTEIRLIEWRIKYPEQLQQRINKQPLSPLYLADKTTLINIMEVVSGLFLSKDIVYQNGKPAYLVDLSKGFEWLFNIKISDCHQKHEDVIKRKPGKLTEFLNGPANLIKNEHDKKGYR